MRAHSPTVTTCFISAAERASRCALEGALKLKEISYIHAEGYAAGELKHGPIALIDEKMPVIVIAPYDRVFEKTLSNLQEVAARRGRIILITDPEGSEGGGDGAIVNHHLAGYAGDRDPVRIRDRGAAHRLSYGGRDGHRCRSAAQFGEIGNGGIIKSSSWPTGVDPQRAAR